MLRPSAVASRDIIVLASGSSTAERNNQGGHLFEKFVAELLFEHGFEHPKLENLNVSANGIELDIVGMHALTRKKVIAECKAYSSPVPAKELSAFYGKLGAMRLAESDTFGFFVAVPTLTANGLEQSRKIEAGDPSFRVLTSDLILQSLEARGRIRPLSAAGASVSLAGEVLSDEALLITAHGLYGAVKVLDPVTRLATRVVVWSHDDHGVPSPVIEELLRTTFAGGLPCHPADAAPRRESIRISGLKTPEPSPPTVVEVVGSRSDFEYQYPASPRFFVGRKKYLGEARAELDALLADSGVRARVVVLNAQSGWGKSSFSLKLIDEARKRGGFGQCIDSRTADGPAFVCAALRVWLQAAEQKKAVVLPSNASFASLQSALETLRQTTIRKRPLCLFFDQFENVFRDYSTTLEFRNLALSVADLQLPILLGFSWKTDLVTFTEGHPYQLRDDIRARATVLALEPFGAGDVSEVLSRLQKALRTRVHRDLREKLREYSQGLPWLLKKLGSHILRELQSGAKQDALVAEVLNVQRLFEADLQTLSPDERAALHSVARNAPLLASDAVELAKSPRIIQSLLDQRLLVQIGERLDVYWDIFRDYLNRGVIPIEDSYILRLTPTTGGRLLRLLRDLNGAPTTPDVAARKLNTSRIAVFNMARDLRQLGILSASEGTLKLSDEVRTSANLEEGIRRRVSASLKRHRSFSLLSHLGRQNHRIRMSDYARELPVLYPAVVAKPKTWSTYARAFAYWFDYAGLAHVDADEIVLGGSSGITISLLTKRKERLGRNVVVFPRCPPQPLISMLEALAAGQDPSGQLKRSTLRRALLDAEHLGLIARVADDEAILTQKGKDLIDAKGVGRAGKIAEAIAQQPSVAIAKQLLGADPGATPNAIGTAVAAHFQTDWEAETARSCGKWLRGWMRYSGTTTKMRASTPSPQSKLPFA